MTRFVQFTKRDGSRALGRVADGVVDIVANVQTLHALAQAAVEAKSTLEHTADALGSHETEIYDDIVSDGRLLPVIDHSDSAHLFVTGTGLTHTGSADARDEMHAKVTAADADLSDSMKIFKMGLEGGRPALGEIGVQPEWFWKGTGSILRASGETMESPHWADDVGEEPEIAGIYLIGPDGTPFRLGFALANEMSDHVMERTNYLFLAHSKLRECALGPELLTGELPKDVQGTSRIYRDGKILWEKPFLSGEANMTHSIANLEHHHFKYPLFRRPGDIHVHLFGTATLSFADGIRLQDGDVMEIHCPQFGRPLRNPVRTENYTAPAVSSL